MGAESLDVALPADKVEEVRAALQRHTADVPLDFDVEATELFVGYDVAIIGYGAQANLDTELPKLARALQADLGVSVRLSKDLVREGAPST